MCQTKSQGGKRCAAHTRPAYAFVMSDITSDPARGQTRADYDDDLGYRVDHGTDALVDHATTATGAQELQRDIQLLTEQYDRHPSNSMKQETVRQGTLSALRVALRQAEARNNASQTARATSDRYSELFHDRNRLQDLIYEREQTVEDSADAHAVNEMQMQLDAINSEMESMETWRRTPGTPPPPAPALSAHERNFDEVYAALFSPEAVATASDEDGAAARMAWDDAQGGPPDPDVNEDGYDVDEQGNAWGVCNSCGDEVLATGSCCDDGEVVPRHDV